MKKHVLLFAGLMLLCLAGFSQNVLNLVVFSEDGDPFYAYVNGIKQNEQPLSNVKITGLTSPNISLRIEFNDKNLPQLKQNMSLEMGYEHTAKIKRDMKKQLKLRYFGQAPLNNSATAGVTAVQYNTAENSAPAPAYSPDGNVISNSNTNTNITTTQTYNSSSDPNNGSVNMSMGGAGITMNVSGMDGGMNTTTSTTVTTTTSSSSSSSSSSNYNNNNNAHAGKMEHREHHEHDNNSHASAGSNNGCKNPMTTTDFDKMKKSVQEKPFSDTKMSTAKMAAKSACLSVNQVKEIGKLFSMDDDKLAYVKYAYDYTLDKNNFYQVSDIFSFSTTTDELNKFLEQH